MEYIGIENFRSHEKVSFGFDGAKIVAFLGKNGIGKTNILEAISIIDGSKGLRGAKINEMKNSSAAEFKICVDINGDRIILESLKSRKNFFLNGSKLSTFFEISQRVNTIWTTPELEYLFFSSQKTRRDFFDKITFCFFNNHYSLLTKCSDLLSQRLKILTENIQNGFLALNEIENQIAILIEKILNNRLGAIKSVNDKIDILQCDFGSFKILPSVKYLLEGFDVEKISKILFDKRKADSFSGINTFSHNKINIDIVFENNLDGSQLSNGQQKFVLINICLAFAKSLRSAFPERFILLLLDDFLSKLDYKNSQNLLSILENWSEGQVFITSTSGLSAKEDDMRYKIFHL